MNLIVAHDIGGGQLLAAFLKLNNETDFKLRVEGPAALYFKQLFPAEQLYVSNSEAEELLEKGAISTLLAGSGWASPLELNFLKISLRHKVHTVCFLDHWVNYRERFGYPSDDWSQNLPDEFWVHDEKSYELAREFFPGKAIKNVGNYFLKLNKELVLKNFHGSPRGILFLSEPVSPHYGQKLGFDEFSSFKFFINNVSKITSDSDCPITIRLHPAEGTATRAIYSQYLNDRITFSVKSNVFEDILAHEYIVGIESIALYYASLLERKVYCAVPIPYKLELPLKQITYLKDLE